MRAKRKTETKGGLWTRNQAGDDVPSLDGLNALLNALHRGDAVNRAEITGLLEFLWISLLIEEDRHKLGRPKNSITELSASVVNELHEQHGVKVAAAASAMVREDRGTDDSRRKLAQSIERTYRKMKAAGNGFGLVSEDLVRGALARLNPRRRK